MQMDLYIALHYSPIERLRTCFGLQPAVCVAGSRWIHVIIGVFSIIIFYAIAYIVVSWKSYIYRITWSPSSSTSKITVVIAVPRTIYVMHALESKRNNSKEEKAKWQLTSKKRTYSDTAPPMSKQYQCSILRSLHSKSINETQEHENQEIAKINRNLLSIE